jgi:hypothetical protein
MDECACDESQLASCGGIFVSVVFDEGFIDGFGAIFLADQVENFSATQIAFEFISDVVCLCGIGGGAFKLGDCFGVATGDGKRFGEFVTD